jgi:hypothetical protein
LRKNHASPAAVQALRTIHKIEAENNEERSDLRCSRRRLPHRTSEGGFDGIAPAPVY